MQRRSMMPAARVFATTLAVLALCSGVAFAQVWPARPVRIVVPLATGSASDAFARQLAQRLTDVWGHSVVVENVPGSNGMIGAQVVTKAPADGYTLMVMAANHVINPSLQPKMPYDAVNDFTWIAQLGFTPLLLVVHPSLPVKSLKDLVVLAKRQPGDLTYGSAGNGSPSHLAMEWLAIASGVQFRHVPYKAISQAQSDLVGGHIGAMFMVPSVALPQAKSGRLRVLATSTLARVPAAADVPTAEESGGLKGFEVKPWVTLGAPPGLRAELVQRIATDVGKITGDPAFQERVRTVGMEVSFVGPSGLREMLQKDVERWGEIVRRSGARID
ncbi:MAG: tripartite tricarboxylate transporter substrate binding protein [Proteobacteria bacterium]|nr:tripartite tricarboxylate transporter substrate binding protein [Burkholderiales bacterium]